PFRHRALRVAVGAQATDRIEGSGTQRLARSRRRHLVARGDQLSARRVAIVEVAKALSAVSSGTTFSEIVEPLALFDLAAPRHPPNRFDVAAADADDFLVQVNRRIGIADDELDLVADLRNIARLLELDFRVLGRELQRGDGWQ